ncbi:transcription factor with AP2 domain(s), putative [Plasmodium berghei]|uniref:AP2 domain transcription factor AP2-SP3 n=3 Tax=Plasmodium berghei TaxID=5821 RepID=A0A509AP74_PLABA|nr:AP2 domain transcription factor AP2-SP3 [Plasmodium berghei ANKA]CXI64130.1 transcription factor with AP2 domain(s), putative [Plasmodium berghei]SCM23856.1 transcription factor with AP2 domain(s), putative [Plasmodium berghei]SCN26808.1 transcription factor with AP2 domain(s), putative [Plasmodium berghei]SCO61164.1 transcription factor with AP2 domain(s), putative [Plasmodium berghei]SCO63228.1 transcription factor with AP2 domain(s), putative [Plasmodium berghei]|eukprot:XP_034422425.1 AP2 domain transcription factor AP2-SP3 [Plasmodium berghei ANKA]
MGSINKNFHALNISGEENENKNKNKHIGRKSDEYINYKNNNSGLCNGFNNKKYIIEFNSDKNNGEIINSFSFDDEKKNTKILNSESSLIIKDTNQDKRKSIWDNINDENNGINNDGYMEKYFEYFNNIENEESNYKENIYNTLKKRNKCIDASLDLSSIASGTNIDTNNFKENFEINKTPQNVDGKNIHVDNNLINNNSLNKEKKIINENQSAVKKNDSTNCENIFINTNINRKNEFIDFKNMSIPNFDNLNDSIKNKKFMIGNLENRKTSVQEKCFDSSISRKIENNIKKDDKIKKDQNYNESEKNISYLLLEKKCDKENMNDMTSFYSNDDFEENIKYYKNLDTILNPKVEKQNNFEYLKNVRNEKSDYFDKNKVMKKFRNNFIKTNEQKYCNYKYKKEKMNFSLYKNQYTSKNYNFYFSDDFSINKKKNQKSNSVYASRESRTHSSMEKNDESEMETMQSVNIKNIVIDKYRKCDKFSEKDNSKFYSCISNGVNDYNDVYDFHYSYSSQSVNDEGNIQNKQLNKSINYNNNVIKKDDKIDDANNSFLLSNKRDILKKNKKNTFNNNHIVDVDDNFVMKINNGKDDSENDCIFPNEIQYEKQNTLSNNFQNDLKNNKNISKTKNNTKITRKIYFFRPKKNKNIFDYENGINNSENVNNYRKYDILNLKKDSKYQTENQSNNSYITEGGNELNKSKEFNEENNNVKNDEIDIFNYEKTTKDMKNYKNNNLHTNIEINNISKEFIINEKKEKDKEENDENKDNNQIDEIHKIVDYIMNNDNVDFSKIIIKDRKNNSYIKINYFLKEYISKYNELEHSDFLFCFGESSEDDVIYEKKKSINLENEKNKMNDTKYARCSFCDSICICDNPIKNLGINNGASILLNKKRIKQIKNRKINYNAIDTMWQPHFHPHNKEFRVRYRYKGSMRLKTISCKFYGYKNSKKISILFLLRWLLCGKYIAEKTKRSRLSISDINEYNLPDLLISKRKKRKTDYMKNEDWVKYENQKNKEIYQYLNKINSFILNHYNDHNFLNKLKNIINTYDKKYKKEKIFATLSDCFKDQFTENKRQSLTYSVKNKINEFMSLNQNKMFNDDIPNTTPSIPYPHYGPYNQNLNTPNINYNNIGYELPNIPGSKINSKIYNPNKHFESNTTNILPRNNYPYCVCSYLDENVYNNFNIQQNYGFQKKKCVCMNNINQNIFLKKNSYNNENEYNIYDYANNNLDKNYNDNFQSFNYHNKTYPFFNDIQDLNTRPNNYNIEGGLNNDYKTSNELMNPNRNNFMKMDNKPFNQIPWKSYFSNPTCNINNNSNHNNGNMFKRFEEFDKNRYLNVSNKICEGLFENNIHHFNKPPEMFTGNKKVQNEVAYNNNNNMNLAGKELKCQLINNENGNCSTSIFCDKKKNDNYVNGKNSNMVINCYMNKNNNENSLSPINLPSRNTKKISNVSTCPSVNKNISFYPNCGKKNTENDILEVPSKLCETNKAIYEDKINEINYLKNNLKKNKKSINPIAIPDDEMINYDCSPNFDLKNSNKNVFFSMNNNQSVKSCSNNIYTSNNCENKDDESISEYSYISGINKKHDEPNKTIFGKQNSNYTNKDCGNLEFYKNEHEKIREKKNIYDLKINYYKDRTNVLENENPVINCMDDSNIFITNKKNKKIQFNDKNQDVKKIFNVKNRKRFTNINIEDIHEILLKSKYLNEVKNNDTSDNTYENTTKYADTPPILFYDKKKQTGDFEYIKRNDIQPNNISKYENDQSVNSNVHPNNGWDNSKHINDENINDEHINDEHIHNERIGDVIYDSYCEYCEYIDNVKNGKKSEQNCKDTNNIHENYKNLCKLSEKEITKQMKNVKTYYHTKNIKNCLNNEKTKYNNNVYDKKDAGNYIHINLENDEKKLDCNNTVSLHKYKSDENKMNYLCNEKNSNKNDFENFKFENNMNFINNQNIYDKINNYTNEKNSDVVNCPEINNDQNSKHNQILDYIFHELNNTSQNCDINIEYTSSILSDTNKDESKKTSKTSKKNKKNNYILSKKHDIPMNFLLNGNKQNSNPTLFNNEDIQNNLENYKNALYSNKNKLKEIAQNENFELIKKFIKEVKKNNTALAQ